MARVGLVTNFTTTSGNKYHFQYDPKTELLRCRSDSRGDVFLYDYDTTGRLQQALTSTGERLKLESRLVPPQHLQVTVARDDHQPFVVNIDNAEQSTTYTYGEWCSRIVLPQWWIARRVCSVGTHGFYWLVILFIYFI